MRAEVKALLKERIAGAERLAHRTLRMPDGCSCALGHLLLLFGELNPGTVTIEDERIHVNGVTPQYEDYWVPTNVREWAGIENPCELRQLVVANDETVEEQRKGAVLACIDGLPETVTDWARTLLT